MNGIPGMMFPALQTLSEGTAYKYVPFLTPLPAWNDSVWPWLLLPLCIAIAVVYKSIKCRTMRQVPREATVLTLWIVVGMAIAAGALALIVEALERFS
ncbi:hypothetical protein [Humisphaera borealis]|uniref:Uncharacterized protein n=1 Tax=Humisphaera borealis TaxID=2807512 RepID=A0A7M2WR63_9BACT|nr:hypothetical protein [Humisphaera borealis]QOV88055.1 hypothetical protein IPV69_17525 [Humisphaera borealis]